MPHDVRDEKIKAATVRRIYRWLRERMRPDLPLYVFLLVCGCLFSLLDILFALLMRGLINAAVAGQPQAMLFPGLGMLGIVAVRVGGGRLLALADGRMSMRLEMRTRAYMRQVIAKKRYADVQKYHSGELMNRLYGDVGTLCSAVLDLFPSLVMMLFGLVGAAVALGVMNPWLPVIVCAAGVMFFFSMRLFRGRIKGLHRQMRAADDKSYSYHQELMGNQLVVKVFSAEGNADARAEHFEGNCYAAWKRWQGMSLLSQTAAGGFQQLGYLIALLLCAWGILRGILPYGDMAAILQLVGKLQDPFAGLSGMIPRYCSAVSSLERLEELELLPDESARLSPSIDPDAFVRIDAARLCFAYEGGEPLFDRASFTLQRGEFVMLSGLSGIGKTTLIHLLLGVYAPTDGSLCWTSVTESRPLCADTRGLFAYVPQGNLLFSGTLRENLTFLCGERSDAVLRDALLTSCALPFVDALPHGLDTVLEEGGRGISEGQAQRLAVARALLSDAPVLLLDEATSALDDATERQLLTNLRRRGNRTILMVSHRHAALDVCDRVWTIRNRKIAEEAVRHE